MRKSILLFSVFFICIFHESCNKEEPVATTRYTIDSIQIELIQPQPSLTFRIGTITNNGDDWQVSFPSSWQPIAGSSYYPLRSVSGDTVQYRQIAYRDYDSTSPWFDFLLVKMKNHRLLSTSYNSNLIGGIGQDGVTYDNVIYQYDADRLAFVNILHGLSQGPGRNSGGNSFFYYNEDSIRFNYNGNTLQSAFYKSDYYDVQHGTAIYSANFNYSSNFSNQKNLIGIDINDFILEAALNLPMKLPLFRFPIGTTVLTTPLTGEILNGISYNTNSDKLIEEIHLHINTAGVTNAYAEIDTVVKPVYIFDSLHNNRITKITYGSSSLNNLIAYLHCKIYYRPD